MRESKNLGIYYEDFAPVPPLASEDGFTYSVPRHETNVHVPIFDALSQQGLAIVTTERRPGFGIEEITTAVFTDPNASGIYTNMLQEPRVIDAARIARQAPFSPGIRSVVAGSVREAVAGRQE